MATYIENYRQYRLFQMEWNVPVSIVSKTGKGERSSGCTNKAVLLLTEGFQISLSLAFCYKTSRRHLEGWPFLMTFQTLPRMHLCSQHWKFYVHLNSRICNCLTNLSARLKNKNKRWTMQSWWPTLNFVILLSAFFFKQEQGLKYTKLFKCLVKGCSASGLFPWLTTLQNEELFS